MRTLLFPDWLLGHDTGELLNCVVVSGKRGWRPIRQEKENRIVQTKIAKGAKRCQILAGLTRLRLRMVSRNCLSGIRRV